MTAIRLTMRSIASVAALMTLGLGYPIAAIGLTVTTPSAVTPTEGNVNNGFPFNLEAFNPPNQRYQQVFAASEFSLLTTPGYITHLRFRPDAEFGDAFVSTLPNIRIDLSTTPKAPDALSTTFADNIGGDRKTVYSGNLTLASANTGLPQAPRNFDITIALLEPFLYNPALGNLLLDVFNFSSGQTTQFDAQGTIGDSVSRVYTLDNVNNPIGSTDTTGLVTQFEIQPTEAAIPTPALLPGLVGFGVALWRKAKIKNAP